jgi:hypothetical protein
VIAQVEAMMITATAAITTNGWDLPSLTVLGIDVEIDI